MKRIADGPPSESKIASENADRFRGRVDAYAKYRTRYPSIVTAWLYSECGLSPAWTIADVGAGTGMLAELFLENGNTVAAIEPNPEMRLECQLLQKRYPRLRVLDGLAEETHLGAGAFDLVTAGRAFHWFERVPTAAEFRRILRAHGWVAIVSSGRWKEDTEQSKELESLLMQYGTDPAHVRDRYNRRDRIREFLRSMGGMPREMEFAEDLTVDWVTFLGSVQSMSISPLVGTPEFTRMRRALEDFFFRWSVSGLLMTSVLTTVDAAQIA